MSVVLFAIIGAHLHLGVGYWICFSLLCLFKVIKALNGNKNE